MSGVKLEAGVNVVVLKSNSGNDGWIWSVKICDDAGNPLPDVRVTRMP